MKLGEPLTEEERLAIIQWFIILGYANLHLLFSEDEEEENEDDTD